MAYSSESVSVPLTWDGKVLTDDTYEALAAALGLSYSDIGTEVTINQIVYVKYIEIGVNNGILLSKDTSDYVNIFFISDGVGYGVGAGGFGKNINTVYVKNASEDVKVICIDRNNAGGCIITKAKDVLTNDYVPCVMKLTSSSTYARIGSTIVTVNYTEFDPTRFSGHGEYAGVICLVPFIFNTQYICESVFISYACGMSDEFTMTFNGEKYTTFGAYKRSDTAMYPPVFVKCT